MKNKTHLVVSLGDISGAFRSYARWKDEQASFLAASSSDDDKDRAKAIANFRSRAKEYRAIAKAFGARKRAGDAIRIEA